MIAGGLWRTDGGFRSSITLRNLLATGAITVTPVIFMADGTELDLSPVTLGPSGVDSIDVNSALAAAPSSFTGHVSAYGSAAVRSQWAWQPVLAGVQSSDDASGFSYQSHLGADANAVNHPKAPITRQFLEGFWWKEEASVSGFLALTNTSNAPITAAFVLGDNAGAHTVRQTYALAPHATIWIDFAPFWAQLPTSDAGMLEVSYTGAMYAVTANGGLEDAGAGYSRALRLIIPGALLLRERIAALPPRLPPNFVMPTLRHSANLTRDAIGLPAGKQDANWHYPPGTTFAPYVVLHNTTAQPMPVRLAANAMANGTPQDAGLAVLQLAPLETRRINVGPLLANSSLAGVNGYVNLHVIYSGTPTDLQEISGSVDQTNTYRVEVPAVSEAPSTASLISYWKADGETDTRVTFFNFGDTAQTAVFTLTYAGGHYELPVSLAPHASQGVSLRQLISQGIPDRNGTFIPANVTQGSARFGGASGRVEERTTIEIEVDVRNPARRDLRRQ